MAVIAGRLSKLWGFVPTLRLRFGLVGLCAGLAKLVYRPAGLAKLAYSGDGAGSRKSLFSRVFKITLRLVATCTLR